MMNATSAQRFNRSLGVRSEEARTVRLFFLHHFFLGIGTILVYVSANVILLENHPETSLPVAYLIAAAGMMGVGKLYAYAEHRLMLASLVVRVVWSVIILTMLIVGLVILGHSVAMAVAIMVAYRAIYLLTNLEFWGISALVFDVRQGKRLFSVISSGDMPAKALGAVLAALVHNHTELVYLLLIAFVFFGAALYTVRLTINSHEVHAAHAATRPVRRPQPKLVQQLFGGSSLIFTMCLSVLFVATVATIIEYSFFVNVKYRFHDQALVMRYLGLVLGLTYLSAMIVKLLVSRRALDRFGILRTMQLLPIAALLGALAYIGVEATSPDETSLMVYYCGLYLIFEVVRRSLFDPVFLVLFQPLPPHQRLKGHTLAKGFYEPLGMALAGFLIYLLRHGHENLNVFLLAGMAAAGLMLLYFVRKTYQQYLDGLHDALGRRFIAADELPLTDEASQLMLQSLKSTRTEEVLSAIDWLQVNQKVVLEQQATELLNHADADVRLRVLTIHQHLSLPLSNEDLFTITQQDPDSDVRALAAYLIGSHSNKPAYQALLLSRDLPVRQGAISGFLHTNPSFTPAIQSLDSLTRGSTIADKLAALDSIRTLQLLGYASFIRTCLATDEPELKRAALATAAELASPELVKPVIELLNDKVYSRDAARSLASMPTAVLPALQAEVAQVKSVLFTQRAIHIAERLQTTEAHQWLVTLVESPSLLIRGAALKALKYYPHSERFEPVFQQLLKNEVMLAQRVLNAVADVSDEPLDESLRYELELIVQRILLVLLQLYDKEIIDNVRVSLDHASNERRANSLELLENLVPRPVYSCLQILVEDLPVSDKIRQFDAQVGVYLADTPIELFILEYADTYFSDWTVACALRQVHLKTPALVNYFSAFLRHPNIVVREIVIERLHQLAQQQPTIYQEFKAQYPELIDAMNHDEPSASSISATERVFILKNNSLFAGTPNNVLSSVVPIMKEVAFAEGHEIVRKGELGTCMYIIYSGQVGIYDGEQELAVFDRGNFFGELALLDTEPRSATAIALSPVTLFRIDQDDFFDLMTEREEVLRNMIRVLSQRIRNLNTRLRSVVAG